MVVVKKVGGGGFVGVAFVQPVFGLVPVVDCGGGGGGGVGGEKNLLVIVGIWWLVVVCGGLWRWH